MRARFEDWVNGLTGDWCVSRQRFFGVPFPLWYPLDADGDVLYDQPIAALEEELPVDPSTDVPDGYDASQRGQPDGFVGDPDVMDTWATSSLTPQIAGHAGEEDELFSEGVPDGRAPAGARHHQDVAVLDGPALAPRLGRAAVGQRGDLRLGARPGPQEDVQVQGQRGHADAPAGGARRRRGALLGGQRTSGHGHGVRPPADEGRSAPGGEAAERVQVRARGSAAAGRPTEIGQLTHPLDRALIARLAAVGADATDSFEAYDYARALERAESFFWWYCDYYLELVKGRRYDPGQSRRPRGERVGEPGAAHVAVGLPAPVRAVPAVRVRGGVVVVAAGLGAPRAVAGRCRADGCCGRRSASATASRTASGSAWRWR